MHEAKMLGIRIRLKPYNTNQLELDISVKVATDLELTGYRNELLASGHRASWRNLGGLLIRCTERSFGKTRFDGTPWLSTTSPSGWLKAGRR